MFGWQLLLGGTGGRGTDEQGMPDARGREGVGGGLHQVCVQRVLQTCQGEAQGDPGALSK